jgi:hypothetical protein
VFEELVNNYGIKKKNSMPFNPQSNGIIERVHLTLNDSLRTAEVDGREMDEKDPWLPFLASAAYAIRSTFHTTLKATPRKVVFGRDMVLPIKSMADWVLIPQVRLEPNYPISPWEMIHPPGGDNLLCATPHTVYTAMCNKSLTATYQ